MNKIEKTKYYSWSIKDIPRGCKLCVKGLKSVLFVTGLCNRNCIFCPISDKKKNKDVVYINERLVKNDSDLIEEIKACASKGVGITGGDPLIKLERTVKYIKLLKKEFGNHFHIHLYTSLDQITENNLKKLYEAGLDEIRVHPEVYKNMDKNISKIELIKKFDWDIGVEIPVIPGKKKEIIELIDKIGDKIKFLNLNELEYTEELTNHGFICKDYHSYAIKDSEELAFEILEYCKNKSFITHYCTVKLKDWVQLKNRLINRAKNTKKWYDKITNDGMFIRGAVYLDNKNKDKNIEKFNPLLKKYKDKFELDKIKNRLLTSVSIIKSLKKEIKKLNLIPAIVEEYPTYDAMEVEVEYL